MSARTIHTSRPLVVSASRATDIPAFHMPWFMQRLRTGSCIRVNPFNPSQHSRIEFAETRVIVFWSKNPEPLIPYLNEIRDMGYEFYIHFTLNDYGREGLEPHVPPLPDRIATFKKIADGFGPHRVIWRTDPLILSVSLTPDVLLERLHAIGTQISLHTEKLVFSFFDAYRKTRRRLALLDASLHAPDSDESQDLVRGLAVMNTSWPKRLILAACAEEQDFSRYGIVRNACIDPELIARLVPHDKALLEQCGFSPVGQLMLPGLTKRVKDPGQRPCCRCLPSRDIGAYNSCLHFCSYCYANLSEQTVITNMHTRDPYGESLLASHKNNPISPPEAEG